MFFLYFCSTLYLSMENKKTISRRAFIGKTAAGLATFTVLPGYTVSGLGHVVPSDTLYIAKVGCGGMGSSDLSALMRTPNKNVAIAALCDVDERSSSRERKTYPDAPYYHDWREMYEARVLTQAAKKFKVVTQMGDQGNSCMGKYLIN